MSSSSNTQPMQRMGVANYTQGICGITSCLYAIHEDRPVHHENLSHALRPATMHTRLMAEIKTFLRMLHANGENGLLGKIETFTRSFHGFGNWSLGKYMASINTVTHPQFGEIPSNYYSIALTPLAVQRYLSLMWSVSSTLHRDYTARSHAILGLTDGKPPLTLEDNLKHYVYVDGGGRVHSWGNVYDDLGAFLRGRGFTVLFTILLT